MNMKKWIALLLCLMLGLSLFPTAVFAEEKAAEEITGAVDPALEDAFADQESALPADGQSAEENSTGSPEAASQLSSDPPIVEEEQEDGSADNGILEEEQDDGNADNEILEEEQEDGIADDEILEEELEDGNADDEILEESSDEETEQSAKGLTVEESEMTWERGTTVNCRCKITADSVVLKNIYGPGTVTLKKGTRVQLVEIGDGKQDLIKYENITGYIDHGKYTGCLLEDCTVYTCYATIKTTKSASIMSLPISTKNDSASYSVGTFTKGKTYTAIGLYKNPSNGYWYKIADGKYISSDDSTATAKYDTKADILNASSITQYPKGTMHVGDALTLKGTVKTTHLPMKRVGCFVYPGSNGQASSSDAVTYAWADCGKNSFSIQGSKADSNCKIGSVPAGDYVFMIKIEQENHYAENGTLKTWPIESGKSRITIFTSDFREAHKLTYKANGGTGSTVPGDQWKYKGKTLTLQSNYPSRSSSSSSIDLTFNANGGSCSTSSLSAKKTTSYTFARWNTKADGSGTNYNPGGSYTKQADATLYAQWTSTTSTSAVTLPYANRSGYDFLGWSPSSTATAATYPGGSQYTPSSSTTLYAVWKAAQQVSFQTSLNLADYTGINVYIGLPDGENASEYTVKSSYHSYRQDSEQTVALSSLKKGSGERAGMYQFDALHAASTEMSDSVTVQLLKGGKVVKTEAYSVRSIAEDNLAAGGLDAATDTLYRALLQYGRYGQLAFGNKTNDLPGTAGAPSLVSVPADYAPSGDPTNFGAYVTGFERKLDLNAATSMNLYITFASGYSLNDFSISVLDQNSNAYGHYSVTSASGNRARVKIDGVLSPQLARNFSVRVTLKSDTTKTATWNNSVLTCAYVYEKALNGDAKSLMQALYQYYLASAARFPQFR